MSYADRKIPIVWTSPSGKVFELDNIGEINYSFKHYGNLVTIMDSKKDDSDDDLSFLDRNNNTINNNSNNNYQLSTVNYQLAKGDIFEDLCTSGRTINLGIIFSGDNHDTESEVFERAFAELGHSKLQLPYLERPIRVNAQTLNKKQDIVKDTASTIIEIEFIETRQNRALAPNEQNNKNALQDNINKKKQSNIDKFKEFIKKLPIDKIQNVIDAFTKNITKVANTISNIVTGDIEAILRDIQANLLNNSLDGTILSQTSKLIDIGFSVSSSAVFVTSLLENITKDITGITTNNNNNQDITNNATISKEDLITNDFFITETFLSSCNNTLNLIQTLNTKKESRQIAETIQELHDNYRNYYEHRLNQLDLLFKDTFIDEIDINSEIQTTVGYIIENSFNLKTEFNITLTEDTNLINLAYKYYREEFKNSQNNNANNQNNIMDYIIRTNHIIDEEFILLPKNRRITLYL
jgi:prophage DNA circulation protein